MGVGNLLAENGYGVMAFAGCPFDDPVAADSRAAFLRRCRKHVAEAVREAAVDPRRCVLLSHDRATRLDSELPGLLLHLYGHVHTFDIHQRAGTTYVNVSALDRMLAVWRGEGPRRYVNAGNYAVIDVRPDGSVAVECRMLERNYMGWTVLPTMAAKRPPGGDLIPEDRIFGDNRRVP